MLVAAKRIYEWARELAPGAQLRRWYGHEPERFEEFARRYRAELGAKREQLSELRRRSLVPSRRGTARRRVRTFAGLKALPAGAPRRVA